MEYKIKKYCETLKIKIKNKFIRKDDNDSKLHKFWITKGNRKITVILNVYGNPVITEDNIHYICLSILHLAEYTQFSSNIIEFDEYCRSYGHNKDSIIDRRFYLRCRRAYNELQKILTEKQMVKLHKIILDE